MLAQGEHVHAIPGTTKLDHLADNLAVSTRAVPADLLGASAALINQHTVSGHRYAEIMRATIDTEDFD